MTKTKELFTKVKGRYEVLKTLFKKALILNTCKEKASSDMFTLLKGDLLVDGDSIKCIAENVEEEADKVIDCEGKLLMPGLINSHTHAYMTLFRNSADDIPFTEWLFERIDPMEGRMEPEDAYWGAMLAAIEMIKTGTTCFLDMHMHVHQTAQAVADSGIRAVLTRGLVGDPSDPDSMRRVDEARAEMERWKDEQRLSFMFAPHAPFTCEESMLRYIAEEAQKLNVGVNIHVAESANEISMIRDRYGLTPVEFIARTGLFDNHCVAAHCVRLTDEDMDILKEKKVSVATNPVSNMKLGNGFARLPEIDAKGINIAIGTDGAGSNNCLNLFHEMNVAALIHKGTHDDPVSISAADVLKYATLGGAEALSLSDRVGVLAPGMKADIIALDMNTPAFYPRNDVVAALAYSISGAEVCMSMVNGRMLMEDGRLLTIDEERVYSEVSKRAARIIGR